MTSTRFSLEIQQLDRKMNAFPPMTSIPPTGWIRAIRTALGMSLEQLGAKLSISKQSTAALEDREREGAVTLQSLRQAARALDMELVYGFVPKDGSLETMIQRKARELAREIVLRTSQSMELEDQANTPERLEKAVEERAAAILQQMPKALWD